MNYLLQDYLLEKGGYRLEFDIQTESSNYMLSQLSLINKCSENIENRMFHSQLVVEVLGDIDLDLLQNSWNKSIK